MCKLSGHINYVQCASLVFAMMGDKVELSLSPAASAAAARDPAYHDYQCIVASQICSCFRLQCCGDSAEARTRPEEVRDCYT